MIIQGSNEPIIIEFDESIEAIKMEMSLYTRNKELKHWSYSDLVISDKTVKAPLKESETMGYPVGDASVELKWKDQEGYNHFADILHTEIVPRRDKTLMGD